jgi:NADH:ubiquinone oxidoreductase subunit 3 (subunit A)
MEFLLAPPFAFLLYLALTALLMAFGRLLASDAESNSPEESSAYASGEVAPTQMAASGYRAFSQYALFFAVFHLGVLLLASSGLNLMAAIFALFLILLLVVLLL